MLLHLQDTQVVVFTTLSLIREVVLHQQVVGQVAMVGLVAQIMVVVEEVQVVTPALVVILTQPAKVEVEVVALQQVVILGGMHLVVVV